MARTATVHYSDTMKVQDCINCGVAFAMPEALDRERQQDHRVFYCPNGHPQVYNVKSDAQKLKEAESRLAAERDNVAFWKAEEAKRRAEAQRVAKRTANGVCPCCSRSFVQLKRHMDRQHPDFTKPKP